MNLKKIVKNILLIVGIAAIYISFGGISFVQAAENKSTNEIEIKNISIEDNNKIDIDKEEKIKEDTIETYGLDKTDDVPIVGDGYYFIRTALNPNKVIEVQNAQDGNGANIQIYNKTNEKGQKFEFKYLGNGEYEIINCKSGKVLDVAYGLSKNGTNVQQYERNNTDAQKWIIEDAGSGYYYIKSKCSSLYLDVAYGLTTNGTNVQIYAKNSTNAQKFKFVSTNVVKGTKTIQSGYYMIATKLNTNKVLDVRSASLENEGNIQIYQNADVRQQMFKITYNSSGFYTIKNVNSKKYLDVAYGLTSNGTNIWQYDGNGTKAQNFAIIDVGNEYYNIVSECNDLYLDVNCASSANGTNVQVYESNGTDAQKFKFIPVNVIEGTQTIANGTYKIGSFSNKTKGLDVRSASKDNGGNIQIWEYVNGLQQKFRIDYMKDGFYKITNVNSGKVLDVSGGNSADGANVQQYDYNGTDSQKWIIQSCGKDGGYNIISALKYKYLTIAGNSISNGSNIEIRTTNETDAQKFYFEKVSAVEIQTGDYGSSGLQVKGDSWGKPLTYYKIGYGPNVFFATFAVHGWEDSYSYDGTALTEIAEAFKEKLIQMQDDNLASKWTIYIFPSVNPDGEYHGTSHNGPGRCSLYSDISGHKGMDINRCFSVGYSKNKTNRNYNGTEPFQAYEARYLRNFLLEHKATNGQTILVDLHGWLNETIGDEWIGNQYAKAFGFNKYINTYGAGYLVNWARSNLGYGGRTARTALIELPMVYNPNEVISRNFANKYINATLSVLREIV